METPFRDARRCDPAQGRLGYVGLGKMGFNMVERLLEKGYEVVAFDVDESAVKNITGQGAEPARTLESLVSLLDPPRLVWLMVPHETVDKVLEGLAPMLGKGDTVIDGGNSFYKASIARAETLGARGVEFLDAGVSGGPSGARTGACIMVGGAKECFERHEPLFRDLSLPDGYGYMGAHGAGHFVKMVHNGIEYGMMQAIAEGFAIMKASPFHPDLEKVAGLYNHGSVITSRLIGWLEGLFAEHGEDLDAISGSVAQSGEGLWTVEAARAFNVAAPVIEEAVRFRSRSEAHPDYTGRILSGLRNQFGKHDVRAK